MVSVGQCPGGLLPENSITPNAILHTKYLRVRSRARPSSALPAATVTPAWGETGQTPRSGNECWQPPTSPEPGTPGPGRAGSGKPSREGAQPGERVKSLRRGRWKITLAPSRPVLLCAARRAIFLRSRAKRNQPLLAPQHSSLSVSAKPPPSAGA